VNKSSPFAPSLFSLSRFETKAVSRRHRRRCFLLRLSWLHELYPTVFAALTLRFSTPTGCPFLLDKQSITRGVSFGVQVTGLSSALLARALAVLRRPRQGFLAGAPLAPRPGKSVSSPGTSPARSRSQRSSPGAARCGSVAAPVGLAMVLNRSRHFETASRRSLQEGRRQCPNTLESGRTAINRYG
jgi:hypothetical protein